MFLYDQFYKKNPLTSVVYSNILLQWHSRDLATDIPDFRFVDEN